MGTTTAPEAILVTQKRVNMFTQVWRYFDSMWDSMKDDDALLPYLELDVTSARIPTRDVELYLKQCCASCDSLQVRSCEVADLHNGVIRITPQACSNILWQDTIDLKAENMQLPLICDDPSCSEIKDTKDFVQGMMADFAICPFTRNAVKAGVPKGNIRYKVSTAATFEEAFHDYWMVGVKEIVLFDPHVVSIFLFF